MVFRDDRGLLPVATRHHGPGPHKSGTPQSVHGRRDASDPSVVTAITHREALHALIHSDAGPTTRDARLLKRRAAEQVAAGWDVEPEDAVAIALDVTGGGGGDLRMLDDLYNLLQPDNTSAGEWVIERNIMADGSPLVHGEPPYLVRHDGGLLNVAPGTGRYRMDTPEGRAMAKEAATSSLIGQWAETSNDNSPGSLALQESIRREFGLRQAADWERRPSADRFGDSVTATTEAIVAGRGKELQSFARSMYDATQRDLAAHGITEVSVMRGYGGRRDPAGMPPIARVRTHLRPASSWSTDPEIANQFGAVQVITTVPASQVLATPRTGFGSLPESEVVLLGQPIEATRLRSPHPTWVDTALYGDGPAAALADRMAEEGFETWEEGLPVGEWVDATLGDDINLKGQV